MASSAYTVKISSLTLDTVSTTLYCAKGTLDLEDTIGIRGVAKFKVYDLLGAQHFYKGQPVEIYDSTGFRVYSGAVDSSKEKRETFAGALSHTVQCVDNAYYADKRVAAKAYVNQTMGFIADDLAGTYLADEGIVWGRDVPILTRASTAYKSDGTQVTSGNPRYEVGPFGGSLAITVEEGTTNLLSANAASAETDATNWFATAAGSTLTSDSTQHWTGTKCVKVVTNGAASNQGAGSTLLSTSYSASTPYAHSVYVTGPNGLTLNVAIKRTDTFANMATGTITLLGVGTWVRAKLTFTTPAGGSMPDASHGFDIEVATQTATAQTFYIDGAQIEQKPRVTSWQLPGSTRSNETLKWQGLGGLHPKHGTIQFRALIDANARRQDNSQALFGIDFFPGGTGAFLSLFHSDNQPQWVLNTGSTGFQNIADANITDGWRAFAIAYDLASVLVYVDGTLVATQNSPDLKDKLAPFFYLGTNGGASNWVNTQYADLRLSSRKRTASEISADAALSTYLPADIDSLMVSNLNGALDAVGTIPDGPNIVSTIVNYAHVSEAFDKLAEKGGYIWNIDANKLLRFFLRGALVSPIPVSGAMMDNDDDVSVENKSPLYRNREFVPGGMEQTSTQIETRIGDGTATSFTLNFPVAKVPTIEVKIGAGSFVAKTVGIKGVDSGKDWYWLGGDAVISQDSAGVKLTSSDTFRATYVGQFPITYVAEDSAEVTANQTLEAGQGSTTGYVDEVDAAPASVNSADAAQIAAGKLDRFSQQGRELVFTTRTPGLRSGTVAAVTLSNFALSGDLLIQSVRAFEDGMTMYFIVTAVEGPVNTTWLDWFARLVEKVKEVDVLQVGAAGTLVIAAGPFADTWSWVESVSQSVQTCLLCNTSTLCGTGQLVC